MSWTRLSRALIVLAVDLVPTVPPFAPKKNRGHPRQELRPLVAGSTEVVALEGSLRRRQVVPVFQQEGSHGLDVVGVTGGDEQGLHERDVVEQGVPDLLGVEVLALLVVQAEDLVHLLRRDLLVDDHRDAVVGLLLEHVSEVPPLADDVDVLLPDLAVVLAAQLREVAAQRLDVLAGAQREREVALPLERRVEAGLLVLLPEPLEGWVVGPERLEEIRNLPLDGLRPDDLERPRVLTDEPEDRRQPLLPVDHLVADPALLVLQLQHDYRRQGGFRAPPTR